MLRIVTGIVDQYAYFSAPPGLSVGSLSVDRTRNGGALAAMTTPTIAELGSNGNYSLLLDEDMTIGAGNQTEAMRFIVSGPGMMATPIDVELVASVSDVNVTTINSATVTGDGKSGNKWRGV